MFRKNVQKLIFLPLGEGYCGWCWEARLAMQNLYFLKATVKTVLILVEGDMEALD